VTALATTLPEGEARPATPRVQFELPPELEATEPAEARGITRDAVRMMVAYKREARVVHSTFSELPRFVDAGDLVVVNTSGTLAAAVDAIDTDLTVHLSTRLPADLWVVELRRGSDPHRDGHAGMVVALPAGGVVELLAPYGRTPGRLWIATLRLPDPLLTYLAVHGRPIKYGYVRGTWPITMYQNVYAAQPGSAEMPSAGRPFTAQVVTDLVTRGVAVAPVVLHTGVSSQEPGEPPQPERFRVPQATARIVNSTRQAGGRVIAVGTTVTRALESAADPDGSVRARHGWTDLVLGPSRPARVVTGLVTGWHAPGASHLALLAAVAGSSLVERAYAEAVGLGYRWHEFGDSCLLLP
jgi:S-adenosylmethionine:tRNA ribosyltransferase-isomerase